MAPTSVAALAVFLAAIVPGYLTTYLWSRNKTWKGLRGDLQTVIQSIVLSVFIQVLLLPYVLSSLYPVRDHVELNPYRVAFWLVLTTLVLPYLLGAVAARLTDLVIQPATVLLEPPDIGRQHRIRAVARWLSLPAAPPSVWDMAVTARQLDGCYVVITWNDGTRIAGTYGIGSAALTTPDQQGIFLNTEWLLNDEGDFDQPVTDTAGILVPSLCELFDFLGSVTGPT